MVVRVFVFLLTPLVRALAALPWHGILDCAPLQDHLQESLGQVLPRWFNVSFLAVPKQKRFSVALFEGLVTSFFSQVK